jgi:hypothetical protein
VCVSIYIYITIYIQAGALWGLCIGPYDARKLGNFSHCFSNFFASFLKFEYLLFVELTGVARASFVVCDFAFMFLSIEIVNVCLVVLYCPVEEHMVCSLNSILVDR